MCVIGPLRIVEKYLNHKSRFFLLVFFIFVVACEWQNLLPMVELIEKSSAEKEWKMLSIEVFGTPMHGAQCTRVLIWSRTVEGTL